MPEYYPLTHPQRRIWHVEQSHPGTSMWNNAGTLKIRGNLDFELLDRAVQLFLETNESIRLRIRLLDGEPVQYVAPYHPLYIEHLDFTAAGIQGLYEWDTRQTQAPMPLIDSPLYYFAFAQTADGEGYLYAKLHHIISDGISFVIMTNAILESYDRLLSGEEPDASEYAESYLAYVKEEKEYEASKRHAYDEAYWLKRFSELPEPTVLKQRKADYFSTKARRKACVLSAELSTSVRAFCEANRVSVFTLLLATVSIYINRVLGKNDLVMSAPVSNRTFAGSSQRFGMYVSTVPVRVSVDEDKSFLEFAEDIANEWFSVLKHQRYPYDVLIQKLHEAHCDIEQLYDIALSYQVGTFEKSKQYFSYEGRWHFSGHQTSSLNIHWNDRENDGRFILDYDYLSPLFAIKEVDFIHEHLCCLIEDAVKHPEKRLYELDIVSLDEYEKTVYSFNDTEDDVPPTDLITVWKDIVASSPEARAFSFRDREISVREVDRRSDEMARYMMQEGVTTGDVVALMLSRSDVYFLAMLAILKAGAAFLPVDRALPSTRVHYMLDEAGVRYAITGEEDLAGWGGPLPDGVRAFGGKELVGQASEDTACDKAPSREVCDAGGKDHLAKIRPESLAYIIYTSGSTGVPKGVMIEHRSISHFALTMRAVWGRTQQGRMLCAGPISFDINIMEFCIGLLGGHELVIADEHEADYPDELCSLIVRRNIDLMMVTPGRMELLLSSWGGQMALRGFREIGMGADVLPPALLKQVQSATNAHITNFYGPTEATIAATCCDVTDATEVNIGRPLQGSSVYILDKHRKPVPIDVSGEIYIGGKGVGRGYIGNDELTAYHFVPSPFKEGERLYRTGDLGRWYPRGDIQFRGRADHQVKIRGFRVELDEIHNHLLEIEGIRSAAVVPFEEDGRKFLCGYLVGDKVPSSEDVKARLAESLPYYMVPAYLMELDELPLTTSEKLDRSRLPLPQAEPTASRPLETETQRKLAALWQDVLGVVEVGRDDHFFELGGDSLSIVRMVGKVADRLDVDIELAEVYHEPTLAACAALIDEAEAGYRRPIKPLSGKRYYPATPTQQRMLFASNQDPDAVTYNVPAFFIFDRMLDEDRLKEALEKLIARHTVLRTSLVLRGEEVMQYIHKEVDPPYRMIECNDEHLNKSAKSCLAPFDPSKAPLMRLVSLRTPKRHALVFDFHHAICDQISLRLIFEDFSSLYRGEELPPLVIDYKDCAAWLHERLATDSLQRHEAFWRDEMKGDIPLLSLPLKGKRGTSRIGGVCNCRIENGNLKPIRRYIQENKTTLFSVLLGAFGIVLARQALQEEVVIGAPVSGRTQVAMQQVVGAFINTLPFRCRLDEEGSLRHYLESVNETVMRALSHQDYPYERIVSDSGIRRERGRNPLFDVMLVVGKRERGISLEGAYADLRPLPNNTSKLDMTLYVYEDGSSLECSLEYDRKLFSQQYARRTLERFVYVLSIMSDCLEVNVSALHALPPAEYQAVTRDFSETDKPFEEKFLQESIETLAQERPDDDAVVCGGRTISFAELNRRANKIAHTLIAAGACREKPVALMMHRSLDLIPALFGIMKAGAAYIPVDPHYPDDRIYFMIEDSGTSILLCDERSVSSMRKKSDCLKQLQTAIRTVIVEEALTNACEDDPLLEVQGTDPAYILYTSGSTGQPKGSLLTRRGVANLMAAMDDCIAYDPSQTGVSVTTMSFDIFMTDAILPLCRGCRTVIADDEELRQPHLLARLIERERVTYLQTTPSRLQIMLRDESFAAIAGSLRTVVVAGEKPSLSLLRTMKSMMPDTRLKNGYGPTEVTVYTSFQDMTNANHVSIGYPIANTHVYILDERSRPVPIGTPAEACISGVGVSPGYVGRDDLNARSFLPDPFRPGNVLYRSGDICYFDESGEIFIVGRADHQVKIRGLRIEIGEIEARLHACKGIKDAVALVWGTDENKQIIAYYTGTEYDDASSLRNMLGQHLPAYMIPTRFIYLDAVPMTANGKVDRTKLPDPSTFEMTTAQPESGQNALLTKEQKQFLRVVEKVLGIEKVSLSDNIFDLGGDSLSIISIQARMARSGRHIRTQDFYDAADFGALLTLAEANEDASASADEDEQQDSSKSTAHIVARGAASLHASSDSVPFADLVQRRNMTAAKQAELPGVSFSRVVVTGATGFLGAHVVEALARQGVEDVTCLVRSRSDREAQERIDEALSVYFPQSAPRVRALSVDITSDLSTIEARIEKASTVIHCAALTEHVGKREDYERVNVEGTRHIIEFSRRLEADLLHVSTTSVAGIGGASFDEKSYHVGQNASFNEYVRSKFAAEGLVLDAFESGLQGRIFRVGNLTGRYADGFFQRKTKRNAFAMRLAALASLGYYPVDDGSTFELTPVDGCAQAMVALSTQPSDGYIFHLCNDQRVDIEELATLLNGAGYEVRGLAGDDFSRIALDRSERDFDRLFGIVRDILEHEQGTATPISVDATVESLARTGFAWPEVDSDYFSRYLEAILHDLEREAS